MTVVHRASLVDPSLHSPGLLEMLQVRLDICILEYLADVTIETVDRAMGLPQTVPDRVPAALNTHGTNSRHAALTQFITMVIHRSRATLAVVLVAITYIQRAMRNMCIDLQQWGCERVVLGALIVASKFLNDSSLKNSHWAICSGIFSNRDIGRVEREFLLVLDWELTVEESDVLAHQSVLCAAAQHQRITIDDCNSLEEVSQTSERRCCCLESPVSYWSDSDEGSFSLPQTPRSVETLSGATLNNNAFVMFDDGEERLPNKLVGDTTLAVRCANTPPDGCSGMSISLNAWFTGVMGLDES